MMARDDAGAAGVSASLRRPMEPPFGSIARAGEPGIFRLRLLAQATLADDEGAVDLGVLLGLGDAVLGGEPQAVEVSAQRVTPPPG